MLWRRPDPWGSHLGSTKGGSSQADVQYPTWTGYAMTRKVASRPNQHQQAVTTHRGLQMVVSASGTDPDTVVRALQQQAPLEPFDLTVVHPRSREGTVPVREQWRVAKRARRDAADAAAYAAAYAAAESESESA